MYILIDRAVPISIRLRQKEDTYVEDKTEKYEILNGNGKFLGRQAEIRCLDSHA
jgi:hypothetical protein